MVSYDQADYLLVPLLDGSFGVAQILEVEATPSPEVFLALTAKKAGSGIAIQPLVLRDIVAFVRVAADPVAAGLWATAGFDQIPQYRTLFDYTGAKALGFPATPIHDPAVIEAFISAWHGLYPWAGFGDLFDTIKRQDLDRPAAAI